MTWPVYRLDSAGASETFPGISASRRRPVLMGFRGGAELQSPPTGGSYRDSIGRLPSTSTGVIAALVPRGGRHRPCGNPLIRGNRGMQVQHRAHRRKDRRPAGLPTACTVPVPRR